MKNLKKMAALGAAAVMALSMNVSAFAEVSVSSSDARFGSYTNGVAKLANTNMIDANNQWTVVLIDADKATANLVADDLYYINQGTNADDFWLTNGMGTRVDLATLVSAENTTKNFIIRIGGETISDATGIIEIPFTLKYGSSGEVTWTYGDVNEDGYTDAIDATEILCYDALLPSVFDDEAEWRFKAGDVTRDEFVDAIDATEILCYDALLPSVLDDLLQ